MANLVEPRIFSTDGILPLCYWARQPVSGTTLIDSIVPPLQLVVHYLLNCTSLAQPTVKESRPSSGRSPQNIVVKQYRPSIFQALVVAQNIKAVWHLVTALQYSPSDHINSQAA
jgi:hypothetical protein